MTMKARTTILPTVDRPTRHKGPYAEIKAGVMDSPTLKFGVAIRTVNDYTHP
jgi:hypothetical protein